ncbi:MAG: EAL domain-containing protein [Candidatus Limnocylindrales bacterium]
MYQAKAGGRHRFQFFESAMNGRAVERYSIEEGLRLALERHEFALVYQPKVDAMTGMIIGAEALLRWNHPTRGHVAPITFVPIAEENGTVLQIGEWVLREATRQARVWLDAGLSPLTMAVNVSGVEFYGSGFVERVFAILDDTGLDPASLEIELTESVLMKRADSTAPILASLRERGIGVAVDDFGIGYSSLGYLRRFPIDVLKIDRSFVSQITRDGDGSSIVAAVITIARGLKIRVVAAGVETAEQSDFVRANGCREVQGFLFSQPVSPERFATLLTVHGVGGVGTPDWPVIRSRGRGGTRRGVPAG